MYTIIVNKGQTAVFVENTKNATFIPAHRVPQKTQEYMVLETMEWHTRIIGAHAVPDSVRFPSISRIARIKDVYVVPIELQDQIKMANKAIEDAQLAKKSLINEIIIKTRFYEKADKSMFTEGGESDAKPEANREKTGKG